MVVMNTLKLLISKYLLLKFQENQKGMYNGDGYLETALIQAMKWHLHIQYIILQKEQTIKYAIVTLFHSQPEFENVLTSHRCMYLAKYSLSSNPSKKESLPVKIPRNEDRCG